MKDFKNTEYPKNLIEDIQNKISKECLKEELKYVDTEPQSANEIKDNIEQLFIMMQKPEHKQAILLRYRDKMSYSQIAEQLGVSFSKAQHIITASWKYLMKADNYIGMVYGVDQIEKIKQKKELEYQEKCNNGELGLECLCKNRTYSDVIEMIKSKYNAEFIKDLNKLTPEQLKNCVTKVIGMGLDSYKQFIKLAIKYGLDNKFNCIDLSYPMNLLDDIQGSEVTYYPDLKECFIDSAEEVEKIIKFILIEKMNKPRYEQVILLRYRDGMTYSEIARQTQVTVSSVIQMINKILRILRRPNQYVYFKYGITQVQQKQKELKEKKKLLEQQKELEYQDKCNRGYIEISRLGSKGVESKIIDGLEEKYNIKYVKDLNNLSPEELKSFVLSLSWVGDKKYHHFIKSALEYGLDKKFDC